MPLDVVIELEEPTGWDGEIAASSSQVGGGFLLVTLPAYTSKDFFVELTAPDNLKDGTDVEFVLRVTPMDDEVPYNSTYTQLSKFNFKTECTGIGCLMNEIYDPEPQTLALGAGLVLLFILAVYRRGRYDSSGSFVDFVGLNTFYRVPTASFNLLSSSGGLMRDGIGLGPTGSITTGGVPPANMSLLGGFRIEDVLSADIIAALESDSV